MTYSGDFRACVAYVLHGEKWIDGLRHVSLTFLGQRELCCETTELEACGGAGTRSLELGHEGSLVE